MTNKEARLHLGLTEVDTEEEILEAFETKLFDWKNFAFKNAPIEKLWLAKLDKLELAYRAKKVLLDDNTIRETNPWNYSNSNKETHPIDWLDNHQKIISTCFLLLQQSNHLDDVIKTSKELLALEKEYKNAYLLWFADWFKVDLSSPVLSKEKLDIGVLTWNLRQLMEEGSIVYIEGEFKKLKDEVPFEESLKKEFDRLHKLKFEML